jgi:hypothetical protein
MRRPAAQLALFTLAAVAALAAGGCRRGGTKTEVARPYFARTLADTTFPHSAHEGVDCTTCHETAEKWAKLGDYQIPSAEVCTQCHEKDDIHTPPPATKREGYEFRFSHANHIPRFEEKAANSTCTTCHKVLPDPGETRKLTPPMSACTSCHAHQAEVMEARCTPCHVSLKRYGLKPLEQFTEFSHTGDFVRRDHGRLAKNSAETCAQCHDQTYCAACHATATNAVRPELRFPENVTSDFIHRGNYASRHHLDAQRDPASCMKCHGQQFCESCHAEQALAPRGLDRLRNPHPRGWVQRSSGAFHGDAARQNIVSCSGCHDQGATSNCVGCHQVGGVASQGGRSPHPPGWGSRHDRSDIQKNVACRACHNR